MHQFEITVPAIAAEAARRCCARIRARPLWQSTRTSSRSLPRQTCT